MNDQPQESTEADASKPTDLLDNLRELGTALPVSFQPNAHDSGALLAGVIWYLATGSLESPKIDTPDQAEANAELAEQTRYNEAQAEIAKLRRQLEARDAGPSPVAPAPTAAVEPEPTAPVDPAAPQEQAPIQAGPGGTTETSHVDPAQAKPVDGQEAAPAVETAPVAPTTPPEGTVGS